MEGANRQVACDLGSTGRLVKSAFTPISAPAPFRERLLQRLVAEASGRVSPRAGAAPAPRSRAEHR
jgi:hypothetical protein